MLLYPSLVTWCKLYDLNIILLIKAITDSTFSLICHIIIERIGINTLAIKLVYKFVFLKIYV